MEKQFYAVYLNPSRPDFAMTMTDIERVIMGQHVAYWTEKMKQGKVYAFGPVIDPKGIYGLGVVAVDNEQELKDIIANDPAGKINKYEYFPMRAVVPTISIG
ncbi:YciI family protein [Flavobacterium maritimum]|uniref:YciI family protein n=1 Tax=Flavobacterium maritimum TaxID=3149042 RepID=UPI0032B3B9D1